MITKLLHISSILLLLLNYWWRNWSRWWWWDCWIRDNRLECVGSTLGWRILRLLVMLGLKLHCCLVGQGHYWLICRRSRGQDRSCLIWLGFIILFGGEVVKVLALCIHLIKIMIWWVEPGLMLLVWLPQNTIHVHIHIVKYVKIIMRRSKLLLRHKHLLVLLVLLLWWGLILLGLNLLLRSWRGLIIICTLHRNLLWMLLILITSN